MNEKINKEWNVRRILGIYITVSCLFLASCFVYYGGRFFYYWNESHNGKKEVITNFNERLTSLDKIIMKGDGLQSYHDGYLYYGDVDDNYVKYSGFLWRILDIDAQGNVRIVTDEVMTTLPYSGTDDNTYENSLIRRYLNPIEGDEHSGYFYSYLNDPQSYLVPMFYVPINCKHIMKCWRVKRC